MNRYQKFAEDNTKIKKIFVSSNYDNFLTMDKIDFRVLISNNMMREIFYNAPFHILEHIINHGVNFNYAGPDGINFVQYAFTRLSDILLKVLIAKKSGCMQNPNSNLNLNRNFPNLNMEYNGGTLIHYVVSYRSKEIIRLMIESGVNIFSVANINDGDKFVSNIQPIHFACWKRNLEIVQMLLNNGSDINASTSYNKPVNFASFNSDLSIIKYLFDQGANLDEQDHQ